MSDVFLTTSYTRIFDLLRGPRRWRGFPPLEVDAKLQAAAALRAGIMVERNYFSHDMPGHRSAREMLEKFGHDGEITGENSSWGEKTAEEAVATWVTSPDHLKNMVSRDVREGNRASHVGIFVRDGEMVNAFHEERGGIVSDLFSNYLCPLYLGARRLA